jgi:hypothetical protein
MTPDEREDYIARLRASGVPEEDLQEWVEDEMERRRAADPANALRATLSEAFRAILAEAQAEALAEARPGGRFESL